MKRVLELYARWKKADEDYHNLWGVISEEELRRAQNTSQQLWDKYYLAYIKELKS